MNTEATVAELELIADVFWHLSGGTGKVDGVTISDVYQHNACNHTMTGAIERDDGVSTGFIIESGDWNGTVILAWGDPEDIGVFTPPVVEPRTFVPINRHLKAEKPAMWALYLFWRKAEWFKELERNYNYDRHFHPGRQTEDHYRDLVRSRGLRPGSRDELRELGGGA